MFRKFSKWFITHCKMEICISSRNYSVGCYSFYKNCIITLYEKGLCLTILLGKNYVLLNSVQEFIEIEAWLLLTFFIKFYALYCPILKNTMLEKGGSSTRQENTVTPFTNFYYKVCVRFCLNTGKRLFLLFLFWSQQKELGSSKNGTRDF